MRNFRTFKGSSTRHYKIMFLQRIPCADILAPSRVLSKSSWPKDPLQKALFGEIEVALLCKEFKMDRGIAANVVYDYSVYEKRSDRAAFTKVDSLTGGSSYFFRGM